jgi:hypothetical protein
VSLGVIMTNTEIKFHILLFTLLTILLTFFVFWVEFQRNCGGGGGGCGGGGGNEQIAIKKLNEHKTRD